MKLVDVPIKKIHVDFLNRHRHDMGDMEGLAANIREMGLLQPIAVDEFYNLIFGERRLEACESLGWKHIPCVVLKLDSLVAGEYAENVFRKQFTKSELAEIGKTIEAELGNRQSQGRPKVSAIAETLPKGNSIDLAAKRAGFKSTESYERAKAVTEKGAPELVAAMDSGAVSIAAAAEIASQPKTEQKRIVKMPKDQQREVVRNIRKTKAGKEADERRARDLLLFRGLYDAVKQISGFHESTKETWEGLWRVSAYDFNDHLKRAIEYLIRLQKEHPNEPKKPLKVS